MWSWKDLGDAAEGDLEASAKASLSLSTSTVKMQPMMTLKSSALKQLWSASILVKIEIRLFKNDEIALFSSLED